MKTPFLMLLLPLMTLACGGGSATAPDAGDPDESVATEVATTTAGVLEYEVICGHVLPDVGKCGNYIKIDDAYVVLEHPSLGRMEFCGAGENGAIAKVAGEMVDGKFVASSYERVN